jgi:protein required for attachment to host cells
MRVRVIVADQSEARFYDVQALDVPLIPAGRLTDSHSDTVHEAGQPEPTPRPAGGEVRPRRDAAMRFARRIGNELELARRDGRFERLVLMAGPAFIGLLRSALPERVRATLVAEVRKDLTQEDEQALLGFLPPEAFR